MTNTLKHFVFGLLPIMLAVCCAFAQRHTSSFVTVYAKVKLSEFGELKCRETDQVCDDTGYPQCRIYITTISQGTIDVPGRNEACVVLTGSEIITAHLKSGVPYWAE